MLTTVLSNIIPPKFVIIQDSLEQQGINILISIVKNHLKLNIPKIHLFCFENNPNKFKKVFLDSRNVTLYDYTCKNCELEVLKEETLNGVIVIDSLVELLRNYGLGETYKKLHKLINSENILQVATILHEDILDINTQVLETFDFIATLKLRLIPMTNKNPRIDYCFRKSGSKIIKEIEEFYFTNGDFCTKVIERPDPKVLLANATKEILPEEVASFKIGLSDKDKKLRDNFTLPYLKTSEEPNKTGSGSIIYNLDENDDWDEEDPDDDLDI